MLIVTTFARSGYLRRALDLGVAGYVLKDAPIGELVSALAEGTVRNYLSAAMAKLGARNRADAARFAQERGWL